ncbi:hypothetical protein P691DRAFT_728064 [Macrolepiota fuliginosa MF-IS2]|uniref:F-box domain-containing protein n=1 Tax=Macrolepiota fuliginosa MF-IS2 TaxID=1400762 RepID=A0A9P6C297_9AGAR|nr:hypothetical protein P691DRAFT_728064 [Macrolepiota fuliginosa MF-IS2]
MSEQQASIQSLSLHPDDLPLIPTTGFPIDYTGPGDRAPPMLEPQQMTAFVATMSPEQQEAFEVQMAEQRTALRLQEKRQARLIASSSIMMTTRLVRVTLLDLPPEILTHVLLYLPFTAVVTCKKINRHFRVLISESAKLQYYIHLGMYGMVDNPCCDIPISERLNQLLVREHRWEEFDFDFYRVIDVPAVAEYKRRQLSAGVFSILYESGVLCTIQIPSEADQEVEWKEVRIAPFLINSGKRVFEQDLQVLITAQPRVVDTILAGPHTVHEIQVHLDQLSTGKPHPDAQRAISFETGEELGEPWAGVECVGDNLVLVLWDGIGIHAPDDQVYVYEWKTGELKMRLSAPFGAYRFPLFLTVHIFLLPNAITSELEYWQIPRDMSEPTSNQPFFILSLPRLSCGMVFHEIYCSARPNPTNGPQTASNPFYNNPHHAIVAFDVSIRSADRPRNVAGFAFFVHRSSLVGFLDIFASSTEQPTPVPYNDWGPSACRWFSGAIDDYLIGWTGGMFGQRYTPRARGTAPLILLNFNPIDVAKALVLGKHTSNTEMGDEDNCDVDQGDGRRDIEENQGRRYAGSHEKVSSQSHQTNALGFAQEPDTDPSSSGPRLRIKTVNQGLDPLDDPGHCFENIVYSSLPYTVRSSLEKYKFQNLFLGEEYVLGTQTAEGRKWIKQLHILHYG